MSVAERRCQPWVRSVIGMRAIETNVPTDWDELHMADCSASNDDHGVERKPVIDAHNYHVKVVATAPKTGRLEAPVDDLPQLEVSSPPEFGGPEHTWSPEHLFVASIATCLMTTFQALASNSGIEVIDYTDHAVGHLQREKNGLYSIDCVTLHPSVAISEESSIERTIRLLEKAEKVCLIGRSVSSRRVLKPSVLQAHHVGT